MRTTIFLASCLTLALTTAAQGNRQLRNNNPYLVQATATHPTTALNYNWHEVNHPSYSNGVGVPVHAWVWRVFPRHTATRGNFPFHVTGFTTLWRFSAASTPTLADAYCPQIQLMGCVARPNTSNGELDPDFNNVLLSLPMTLMPSGTTPFPPTSQTWRVTNELASSMALQLTDYSIAQRYEGGEEQNKSAGAPGSGVYSQGAVASWQDGSYSPFGGTAWMTDGFAEGSPLTISLKTTDQFVTWCGILTDEPSLAAYSDYGQRRIAPLSPPLLGHSIGTYSSDVGTASPTSIGVSIRSAASNSGLQAIVLTDFHPRAAGPWVAFPGFTLPVGNGIDIALNIVSPFFNVIDPWGVLLLGAAGEVDAPPFMLPSPNPVLLGSYFGMQGVIVDLNNLAFETTEAAYIWFAR